MIIFDAIFWCINKEIKCKKQVVALKMKSQISNFDGLGKTQWGHGFESTEGRSIKV